MCHWLSNLIIFIDSGKYSDLETLQVYRHSFGTDNTYFKTVSKYSYLLRAGMCAIDCYQAAVVQIFIVWNTPQENVHA